VLIRLGESARGKSSQEEDRGDLERAAHPGILPVHL
jgi:hypothetical protein